MKFQKIHSGLVAPIYALVIRFRCWWFGCEYDEEDEDSYMPIEYMACKHCGGSAKYSDLVGDTRHNRFKAWCYYWLFRKWWPAKCEKCGRRWRECDWDEDHIPF